MASVSMWPASESSASEEERIADEDLDRHERHDQGERRGEPSPVGIGCDPVVVPGVCTGGVVMAVGRSHRYSDPSRRR